MRALDQTQLCALQGWSSASSLRSGPPRTAVSWGQRLGRSEQGHCLCCDCLRVTSHLLELSHARVWAQSIPTGLSPDREPQQRRASALPRTPACPRPSPRVPRLPTDEEGPVTALNLFARCAQGLGVKVVFNVGSKHRVIILLPLFFLRFSVCLAHNPRRSHKNAFMQAPFTHAWAPAPLAGGKRRGGRAQQERGLCRPEAAARTLLWGGL